MKARRVLGLSAVLLAVLVLAALLYVQRMRPQLELGVGYAARVACGCRYIGNRPIGDCYKDFEPGMEAIRLEDVPAERAVRAYVPLIASRTVRFDPLLGCQAEPYRGKRYEVR